MSRDPIQSNPIQSLVYRINKSHHSYSPSLFVFIRHLLCGKTGLILTMQLVGYAWFIIHGQWLQMSVCLWSYPNQGHTTRVYLGPKHRYSHGRSFLGAKAPLPSYKQFLNYILRIIFHKNIDADFSDYNIRWHTTHTCLVSTQPLIIVLHIL